MARNPPVDIQDVGGAPPSATNPIPVRLSDGAGFYVASGGSGGGGAISTSAKGTTAVGNPTSTDVDANRQALDVYVRGGGAGGGAVTVADGADVALGAVGDIAWVSGNGSLIAISKAEFAKLEAIRALLAGSIAVSGTFWQATQPVSGPLTDTQLRASAVPVSGPLTDTQLRASAVPVSNTQLPAALAAGGGLKVEGVAGGVAQPVSGTFWQATQPVSLAGTQAVNQAQIAGTATDVNSGNKSAGTQRVVLATDQPVVPVSDNAGSLTVDAPVGTPAFVRLSDGAAAITALPVTDNAGSLTVDGTVTTNAAAATTGGATPSKLISAATTNATSVKASAGQVYGWYLYNANAAVRYFKLYNKASAPTVGTDTPLMTIPIPPGSAANVFFDAGLAFGTGIAFALTTGVADADTGAVAANEIVVNLFTK